MTNNQDAYVEQLAELLSDLRNPDEVQEFLQAFLSKTELQTLSKRLEIIRLLSQQAAYQEIQKQLKVSSATVAGAASFLETAIAKKILYHISVAQWATSWSKKVTKFISR